MSVTEGTEAERRWRALGRNARAAIEAGIRRAPLARAWKALQEHNRDGQAVGPRPYAVEALPHLEAAQAALPDDSSVLHHLAIYHHALAWDQEMSGNDEAHQHWSAALGYWRQLKTVQPFWTALRASMQECSEKSDPAWVDELRRDLLDHLLEIHIMFIRHYCERDELHRAGQHIDLVMQAHLPPLHKKQMPQRLFQAMTGSLDTSQHHDRESTFRVLERFFVLYPDHAPALEKLLHVAQSWVEQLSYELQWPKICELNDRCFDAAARLAGSLTRPPDLMALGALQSVAGAFGYKAYSRAGYEMQSQLHQGIAERATAFGQALEVALNWGALCVQLEPRSPWLCKLFTKLTLGYAETAKGLGGQVEGHAGQVAKQDLEVALSFCIFAGQACASALQVCEESARAELKELRAEVLRLEVLLRHYWSSREPTKLEYSRAPLAQVTARPKAAGQVPEYAPPASETNPWGRGSVTRSPYSPTAFRVAGVVRNLRRHRRVIKRIDATRRTVSASPGEHPVLGAMVDVADINAAAEVLTDVKSRVREELLEHAPEVHDQERYTKLLSECAALVRCDRDPRHFLASAWEPALIVAAVAESSDAAPEVGALETALVFPTGHKET